MKNNKKYVSTLFLSVFAVVSFGKMQLNLNEPFYDNDLIYAGYVIILFLMTVSVFIKTKKFFIDSSVRITAWIYLYVILWGFVFRNNRYIELIEDNTLKMCFFISFFASTAYWVNRLKCFVNFLKTEYIIQWIFILMCFFLYSESGNWISNLLNFFSGGTKNKIGYGGNANVMGSLCFITIILGSILVEYTYRRRKRVVIHGINLFLLYILLTTSCRIAQLCTAIYYLIILFYRLNKRNPKLFIKIVKISLSVLVGMVLIILFNTDHFYNLLFSMNRIYAISYYMEALKKSGRWITGIGYINYGKMPAFLYDYGIKITWSESGYTDILVTTGILGVIWLVRYYYMMIKNAMKSTYITNSVSKVKIISLITSFLIYGVIEPVGFTDGTWISFSFMVIVFCLVYSSTVNARSIQNYKEIKYE